MLAALHTYTNRRSSQMANASVLYSFRIARKVFDGFCVLRCACFGIGPHTQTHNPYVLLVLVWSLKTIAINRNCSGISQWNGIGSVSNKRKCVNNELRWNDCNGNSFVIKFDERNAVTHKWMREWNQQFKWVNALLQSTETLPLRAPITFCVTRHTICRCYGPCHAKLSNDATILYQKFTTRNHEQHSKTSKTKFKRLKSTANAVATYITSHPPTHRKHQKFISKSFSGNDDAVGV